MVHWNVTPNFIFILFKADITLDGETVDSERLGYEKGEGKMHG
jgi:hypothetical protein